jgi:hypothetical protein
MNEIKGKIYGAAGLCYPAITITENIEKEFKNTRARTEQEILSKQQQTYSTVTTENGPATMKI